MNRETIEKAAREYAEENAWYPGETSYESDIQAMEEAFADAYKAGALWRINSVWHDISEVPEKNRYVAAMFGGKSNGLTLWYANDAIMQAFERHRVIKWAYIDDLLPE